MSQENVDAVRRAFEVFDRGDLREALDFMDPDIEWDVSGVLIDQEIIIGRHAVLEYLERTFDALPFTHVEHRFIDSGDRVCVLASIAGRGAGSGAELRNPVAYVMTVRAGKITRSQFFSDQTEALHAVGLEE